MFKVYFKGDDVPSFVATVAGVLIPSVKFGGAVVIYRWKGTLYLKPFTGSCVVHVCDGIGCHINFNKVVLLNKTSPLNLFRRIRYLLTNAITQK